MRATITIFLLIGLAQQCRVNPVSLESALKMFGLPAVSVTETSTDAPAEDIMQTPDEFLQSTLLRWARAVFSEGFDRWKQMNYDFDAPLNDFRWTFKKIAQENEEFITAEPLADDIMIQANK
ncbi:Hypothetical predicted protein [Cloeon dipterum]|uniref:Uncharacterized protein n=1 Tax=Cloeon dipterum TaxID=197152 RepID=A0A8S1E1X3_9INSE|nr:Hypothetical predicted protein [Cloeon dipterum]